MTKLTVRQDMPGYDRESGRRPDAVLQVFLNGIKQDRVETVDTERGFIDVLGEIVTYPYPHRLVHRLFGTVQLIWGQRE